MRIFSDQRPFVINVSIDLRPSPKGAGILRKYGKSSDGRHISRDILVPGDITLAALHFVIQNAFGFTNNHLKRFYLDNDQFLEFTKGSMKGYKKLLGVLFRIVEPDDLDQFWNDIDCPDLSDDDCFFEWMKNKCKGPYCYRGNNELPDNLNKIYKSVASWSKENTGKTFLDETFDSYGRLDAASDFEFNNILTRLPLRTILGTEKEVESMKCFVTNYIDKYSGIFPTFVRPITDRINYQYDFGDDWNFRIVKRDDIEISDSDYRKAVEAYTPIALKADGVNLLEDVGGIHSFIDFLYDYCVAENEDMIEWSGDWEPEVPNLETMF